jgi:predicted O-linked N-acetylglucosamine transferase (SPINDLY family)
MGYSSSSGDDTVYDYIITDTHTIGSKSSTIVAENTLQLPETAGVAPYNYKPTSTTSRAENRLPAGSFIFACFNQSYKITESVFLLWCEILKRVGNSILWLYVRNEDAKEQILSTAKQQGLDASRFVFAPYVDMETHLKRLPCADLVLDTMPYGNHSTGGFTLMCEVPMMAYRGKSYVASVSASLMKCIGAPEMIVENEQDYVELAVRFATDESFRHSVQAKVHKAATTPAPLFDAKRFVAHYQKGLEMVWENYLAGQKPRDIEVPLLFEPYVK